MRKLIRFIPPLIGIGLFVLVFWTLHNELKTYHFRDIIHALRSLPPWRIELSFLLTTLDYLLLTGYEALAFVYIGKPLSYGRIAFTSFITYAFCNSMSVPIFSGNAVRYRFYSAWGFSALEITKIAVFLTGMFVLGLLVLAGIIFLFEPLPLPDFLHLPVHTAKPLGLIFLAVSFLIIFWNVFRKKPLKIGKWEIALPDPKLSLFQVFLTCLDLLLVCGVIYILIPVQISFLYFLGIFLLGISLGIVSQIPGGLGVFEAVVLLFLKPYLPAPQILGILIAYRGIYYLFPLLVAFVLFGSYEIAEKKNLLGKAVESAARVISAVAPPLLSVGTFLSGTLLLLSGSIPVRVGRMQILADLLPVSLIETSHFLSSLIGAGLLILAWGLYRRLNGAYHLTVGLLGLGIVFLVLKGFHFESAFVLSLVLWLLFLSRKSFYRKSSLLEESFRPGWFVACLIVLASSVWIGFFSFKHVEYSNELWWRFAFFEDAPRFLRATIGASSVLILIAILKLVKPVRYRVALPNREEVDKAQLIVSNYPRTYSYLALLGDKALLFSRSGRSFLMYGVQGKSWITQGDPIGPQEEWPELLWKFREMSDYYGGRTVFFEIGKDNLHLYMDLGLTFLKVGEEARIPLENFTLDGSDYKEFRQIARRGEKESFNFEIVPVPGVAPLIPELKTISDVWLMSKNTKEKGFALGYFEPSYLERCPMALIRREGKIIAFANLLQGGDKQELSIDLMRYLVGEAPHGIMDYLLLEILLWGKQEGYRAFDLGLSILSGLESHALSSLWNRLGSLIYRHGEHFYNFQGLRRYKEKFHPIWEPSFLAAPGGFALPSILTDISALISGSFKGIISK